MTDKKVLVPIQHGVVASVNYQIAITEKLLTDLQKRSEEKLRSLVFVDRLINVDTTPIPLGIEGKDGRMIPVFRKGTAIPCEKLISLELDRGADDYFSLNIFQGFSANVKENVCVAKCSIHVQNDSATALQYPVDAKLAIDVNGILTIKVMDRQTKQSNKVHINLRSGGLSKKDIADLERRSKE